MTESVPSILLVDDNEENLASFGAALTAKLHSDATVRCWCPTPDDIPLEDTFAELVDASTALVVTDYDLTTSVGGFFGPTIVGWCQSKAIPVADFSRAHTASLPQAPNLFELRVPADDDNGSTLAACLLRGFESIRSRVVQARFFDTLNLPLSATLAEVLERPDMEVELAPYFQGLGASNSALFEKIVQSSRLDPSLPDLKPRLLAYILGHVLWNAILRYPGVLLSGKALCAYFGTTAEETVALGGLFDGTKYTGPFGDGDLWFWRYEVDAVVENLSSETAVDELRSFDHYNRSAAADALGRPLADHPCDRCGGSRGGFLCPFTSRPVCDRSDCSTPESSWIPAGAYLARVEKDFHDEWAPILGL